MEFYFIENNAKYFGALWKITPFAPPPNLGELTV
jgi:hypothetical protein